MPSNDSGRRETYRDEISGNTALLLIDVQQAFDRSSWGTRNHPDAETRIRQLLEVWRETERPIIHVQHLSTDSGSPFHLTDSGHEFKPETAPTDDEPVFQKEVNSAFIDTDLEAYLHDREIQSLLIVGLTTNHCVSTTARMAENLGFATLVVADATAAFESQRAPGRAFSADTIHEVALENLRDEFAHIVSTDEILASVSR